MAATELAVLAYLLIATLAMIPTYHECRASPDDDVAGRLRGLLACLLWPLVVTAVVVAVRHDARRHDAESAHG